jgi:ribose transport system ATP-binding protein
VAEALKLANIEKRFGGVRVISDVSLQVEAGTVLGLVGRNGAGKSTIVKILSGYHMPDAGEATIWGQRTDFPIHSSHGVAVIQQELGLNEKMTVLENIGISSAYGASWSGIRWRRERQQTRELIAELGLDIDVHATVGSLHPAARASVALVRAVRLIRELRGSPPLLVLDEPTVYMGPRDRARLFEVVRGVVDRGGAAIFVSHRISEVLDLCDSIAVLRDGQVTARFTREDATVEGIVIALVGSAVAESRPPIPVRTSSGSPRLSVEGLTGRIARNISFAVPSGEILGITGLAGMGQEEIPYLIVGQSKGEGEVQVEGVRMDRRPTTAARAGVRVVPANRLQYGVWRVGSARENLTITDLWSFWRGGFFRKSLEQAQAQDLVRRFAVHPAETERPVERFSGGNQQKLVMARALQQQPKVLILHEPTQGVDVGTRAEIWNEIRSVAAAGTSVVVCSSDVDEVVALSHRVLVLLDGQVARELVADEVTVRDILTASNAGSPGPADAAPQADPGPAGAASKPNEQRIEQR